MIGAFLCKEGDVEIEIYNFYGRCYCRQRTRNDYIMPCSDKQEH